MREIQLTQGKVALVDDCDYERLNQVKWCVAKNGNTFYVVRQSPRINGVRHGILMHHEIIGKPSEGLMTDHINGCGTDNRRENLRQVTCRQNGQNRKDYKKSSKYPGVNWSKVAKKWRSYIMINKKIKHLGYFTDEYGAFVAYKKAVNKIGEEILEEA